MNWQRWRSPGVLGLTFTLLLALFAWSDLSAQNVTGTIRGRVVNESGAPVTAATITARNPATGVSRSALSSSEGTYVLAGMQPGSYEISVQMLGYSAEPRTVRVLIGQSLNMDLQLQPQAIELTGISVIGTRAVETKTSEVAMNVTQEQLEGLPQADRNFLNFAGLAPGITVSREETNKNITAGGLPATKINVFVDGASLKNDILEGGVHGQDASRGNPFPQIALQEFRVLTQNFKAEYQRAGSAIITATTKSGTNDFEANGFVLGQNKGLVELNPGVASNCAASNAATCPKPEFERLQLGLSFGGPIVRDKAHFFAAFEGNYQNRQEIVGIGTSAPASTVLATGKTAASYQGTFDQPFRSSLGVAKLSFTPATNQTLDVSWNGRFETDKRGFGGQTSFESAENVAIKLNVLTLQHSMSKGDWLNQVNISGQRSKWNPTVVDDNQTVGFNYEGLVRVGARDSEQRFTQDRIAIRDDLTKYNIKWNGDHVVKLGANVDFLNYEVLKRFNGNPLYVFNPATSLAIPIRAHYGFGDPGMDESNVQFGAYIQDDWDVNDKLQLNLGLRWDAETNQFNNNWVTPDSIRQKFANVTNLVGSVPIQDRFTDGSDRPIFLGAFQPRVGFSYDFKGDARTVLHGGYGLYFDREIWNHLIDERFRLQWSVKTFEFAAAGEANKIAWNPNYLTPAGLQSILTSANPNGPTGEVFLLDNNTKPPRSHQFNAGIRQIVGPGLALGAQYRGVRGEHIMSWYCGKPHPEHGYCEGGRFAGLTSDPVLSTDEGKTQYDAFDLTAEKPFTEESKWGVTVSYTNATAKQKGEFFFTLDHPNVDPKDWPMRDGRAEKHHVTASAMVALPADFRISTVAQWGSGIPFNENDEAIGWGPARVRRCWYCGDAEGFKQVDLRLEKSVGVPGRGNVGLIVEAVNVFNSTNYRNYEELKQSSNFRKPQWWSADQGRRIQFGLNFGLK